MLTKVTAPVASLWLLENVRVTCLDGVCAGGLDGLRPTGALWPLGCVTQPVCHNAGLFLQR